MSVEKIKVGIEIGLGLIQAGIEIVELLKKDNLTDDDIKAMIGKENAAQAAAKDKLQQLLAARSGQ